VDLNESPGAYHGIAESHVWLTPGERLKVALKACDLYLARMTRMEAALEAVYARAEALTSAFAELGVAVNALGDVLLAKEAEDADGAAAAEPSGTG
jgi:hypothetical protein